METKMKRYEQDESGGRREMEEASVKNTNGNQQQQQQQHQQHDELGQLNFFNHNKNHDEQQQQQHRHEEQHTQKSAPTDLHETLKHMSPPPPPPPPPPPTAVQMGNVGAGAIERAFDEIFTTSWDEDDRGFNDGAEDDALDTGEDEGHAISFLQIVDESESYRERLTETYIAMINRISRDNEERGTTPRIAIATAISANWSALVVEVLPWMLYHTYLGVRQFYIMIDNYKPRDKAHGSNIDAAENGDDDEMARIAQSNANARLLVEKIRTLHHVHVELLLSEPRVSVVKTDKSADDIDGGGAVDDDEGDNDDATATSATLTPAEKDTLKAYETYYSDHRQGSSTWKGKPGNYVLMMKQGFWVGRAIALAYDSGSVDTNGEDMIDWLIHMDIDELFHPDDVASVGHEKDAGQLWSQKDKTDMHAHFLLHDRHSAMSMLPTFRNIDDSVCMMNFLNYEAIVEHKNVQKRFEEVTLFKANSKFMTEEAKPQRLGLRLGGNIAFINLYVNGKSATRVKHVSRLRPLGPHAFKGDSCSSDRNPSHAWKTAVSPGSYILHYAYASWLDVKRRKFSCPFLDAAKTINDPMASDDEVSAAKELVKSCFVLNFDERAFIVAVLDDDDRAREFFNYNLLLQNGAVIEKCHRGRRTFPCRVKNVETLINTAIQAGVMRRFTGPSVLFGFFDMIANAMMSIDGDDGGGDDDVVDSDRISTDAQMRAALLDLLVP